MGLSRVKQGLRELPYTEMKALAVQAEEGLGLGVREDIADVLATLPVEATPELDREAEILQQLFRRKRNITIQPHGTGYKISMLDGPYIVNEDIREGISQFIDTLAALKAMEA